MDLSITMACGEILREQEMLEMSQPSSDSIGAAYRRKVWTKLIVFVVLVAVVWLQPKIQAWLDGRNAGTSHASDKVVQHDSDQSATSQRPVDRRRVVIKDVDQPVIAEVDHSAPASSPETEEPQVTEEYAGSEVVRIDRNSDKKSTAGKDSATDASKSKTASAPGQLREIRKNVFESTAGLRYLPGSADNHRVRHVMQHAKDDTSKVIHGVFDGDRDQILAVIDEAYQNAKKGGHYVRSEEQNDRLVYTVNLKRKIGYMGGSEGNAPAIPIAATCESSLKTATL
ncbi:MAG: hypothetical protein WKF77_19535 [Planctomycetaceae bacterium]